METVRTKFLSEICIFPLVSGSVQYNPGGINQKCPYKSIQELIDLTQERLHDLGGAFPPGENLQSSRGKDLDAEPTLFTEFDIQARERSLTDSRDFEHRIKS